MLRDWLGELSLERFRDEYLHRQPLARPATARSALPLFDWDVLGRLLAAAPEALVVARGELLPFPQPRELIELRAYFRMGIGLCLRHGERHDPGLRGVARTFEADVGASHVQLFVTPGGTYGFGWHYDDEDVFIVQTAGVKDYCFRANTVTMAPAEPAEFAKFSREDSTIHTATLVAGDFLYVPARWWHMAECREDSLSISVGVSLAPR